jgi:hypothetical protein
MWSSEYLDAIEGGGWGVFIASNHFLVVGYFLLAMGTPNSPVVHRTCTIYCPVRATSALPLGFRATWSLELLSCSCTGQSGATPDVWCALTSASHCSQLFTFAV